MRKRTTAALILLVVIVAADGLLLWRRSRYRAETDRLRANMTVIERQRTDAIVAAQQDESALTLQLMRRQASGDAAIHLAVSAESGFVALDRGPARLRVIPATFGADARVGTPPDTLHVTVPRGARTIERLLSPGDTISLPAWVWTERRMAIPESRSGADWAGADAIMTTGGALIYATPKDGPLADSSFVLPGAVRVSRTDLAAIRASLVRGTAVYFY